MTHVHVTSATKLTPTQMEKVTVAVEKKYGKSAPVNFVVDPSVLGGISITVGSRQIDTTLKGKLDFAKQRLLQLVTAE